MYSWRQRLHFTSIVYTTRTKERGHGLRTQRTSEAKSVFIYLHRRRAMMARASIVFDLQQQQRRWSRSLGAPGMQQLVMGWFGEEERADVRLWTVVVAWLVFGITSLSRYTSTDDIINSEKWDNLPRRVLYSTPLVECSHLASVREHPSSLGCARHLANEDKGRRPWPRCSYLRQLAKHCSRWIVMRSPMRGRWIQLSRGVLTKESPLYSISLLVLNQKFFFKINQQLRNQDEMVLSDA